MIYVFYIKPFGKRGEAKIPNKNKAKGNAYERQVCDFLTETYKLSFTRVPNSGALIGGKNAFRKKTLSDSQILLSKGDIVPPDELQHLVIECKSYKDFPFHQFLSGQDIVLLDKWIGEVEYDAEPDDFWMLFFKIARKGEYVVINRNKGTWPAKVFYKNDYIVMEKKAFFNFYKNKVFHHAKTKGFDFK